MPRILIFSDPHYSTDSRIEERRWFPEATFLLNALSRRWAERFLHFWDRLSQRSFARFSEKVRGEPYAAAVCLGDMTPGVNSSGLISEKARQEAIGFRQKLSELFSCPLFFALGNHDLGYAMLVGQGRAGASLTSLRTAQGTYNTEPFYTATLGGKRCIFIASDIVMNGKKLADLHAKQLAFLRRELAGHGKALLFFHSHRSLYQDELQHIVREQAGNIEAIVCGDTHSRRIGQVMSLFLPSIIARKIVFVPAVTGFFGLRRGFVELTIDGPRVAWKRRPL